MLRFAANLSMLFAEAPFLDRFALAARAGFAAVECQFPYVAPAAEIRARLVQWVTFVSPWLMVVNILSAALLAWTLPVPVAPWLRWTWCGLVCAMCTMGLAGWLRHRHKTPTRVGPSVDSSSRPSSARISSIG